MTHLAHVITHVRAKSRHGQYDAILLAEIDRLRAENERLRAVADAAVVQYEAYGAYAGLADALATKETHDV